jgi:uncharacterized protein (DUF2147 family)
VPICVAVLLLASALASPAPGASVHAVTDDVRGLWVDHRENDKRKVAIWVDDCNGLLCGSIYWQKKPLTASGRPKHDRHNPDTALRDRPLCGLTILTGFRRAQEGTWNAGQIYNPGDGQTYSSTLQLERDGSLRIHGYVGLPLFGKVVEWVRPKETLERCG